jgi:hypothetical protein
MASPLGRFASYIAFGSLPGQVPSVAIPSRALRRYLWTAQLNALICGSASPARHALNLLGMMCGCVFTRASSKPHPRLRIGSLVAREVSIIDWRGLLCSFDTAQAREQASSGQVEAAVSHLAPFRVNDTLVLDVDTGTTFEPHHYAFKVSDPEFDTIFQRIEREGIAYGSGPRSPDNMAINHRGGERRFYFKDPTPCRHRAPCARVRDRCRPCVRIIVCPQPR